MLFWLKFVLWCHWSLWLHLQYFKLLVGWQEWHPAYKNPASATPEVLLWETFREPSLTWRNFWQNRPVKQNQKSSSICDTIELFNLLTGNNWNRFFVKDHVFGGSNGELSVVDYVLNNAAVSESVRFNIPINGRWVFPVNHLHQYWQTD